MVDLNVGSNTRIMAGKVKNFLDDKKNIEVA
jgi:hypothetical protein